MNLEGRPNIILARNTNSSRIQEDYVTQVSEEIDGRLTKKLSQEFNKTKNCILGASSRLDGFFQNSQTRADSGLVSETSRNSSRENQGTNEERSQNDSHPEVEVSPSQCNQDLSPEESFLTYIIIFVILDIFHHHEQ